MAGKRVVLFDKKNIIKRLREENQFVINICRTVPGLYLSEPVQKKAADNRKPGPIFGTEQRATSLEDLQRKLQEWKGKSLGVRDQRFKKSVKNKISKHKKKDARKAKKNLKVNKQQSPLPRNDIKPVSEPTISHSQPTVPNSHPSSHPKTHEDSPVAYNKFDHYEYLADEVLSKRKSKGKKNPEHILKELERRKKYLESVDEETANLEKKNMAWKTALARSEGVKVQDDPKLLIKAIKNKERQKRKSKREWEQRTQQVEMKMKKRQETRAANIQERQKKKKSKKMQKLVKKGRLIPGYSKFE